MKKLIKILLIIVAAGAIGGYIYWQYNKKKIVNDSIANAIVKKTDSLYYLQYDSSVIDEINGNAAFYNVVLQSDDAQKALLNSADSLPNALYNIKIKKVMLKGVDIIGILQNEKVKAKTITLEGPVIQIINTGVDQPKMFTMYDTLELYQKMLGKFKSIKSDTIRIINGTVLITTKAGKPQATLENINVTINNFLVDSTKNYQSIISYFVKEVSATIENIQIAASKNNTSFNLEKVDYNAVKRSLHIASIKQYRLNDMNPVISLNNLHVSDLNTDAFIIQQRLKAGQITCDGGLITIYLNKNSGDSKAGDKAIELSADIIDQAQIAGINLGSTKIIIADKNKQGKAPFILTNAKFKVTKMLKVNEGTTFNNLINNAEWELSADGFSIYTNDKLYKISIGDFIINSASSWVNVKGFALKPLLTEQQFVKQSRYQNDHYNLTVKNIILSGVNIKRLLSSQQLEVENASFTPAIKIFNDRTLPDDSSSKLGKYPHQALLKLPFPIFINKVRISNGDVSYREKALKSKLTGNVFFSGINATLLNVTNIPSRIKVNALLQLTATAKFLGVGDLSTAWKLPMNNANGAFQIKGRLTRFNAVTLNSIIEPLAMASVKQGIIDEVNFSINGTDTKATGNVLFLYHDLKMEILKIGDDAELKKKGFISLLANTLIKNENTSKAAGADIIYNREISKSFFNLVWKTIFTGAKKTVMGKTGQEDIK